MCWVQIRVRWGLNWGVWARTTGLKVCVVAGGLVVVGVVFGLGLKYEGLVMVVVKSTGDIMVRGVDEGVAEWVWKKLGRCEVRARFFPFFCALFCLPFFGLFFHQTHRCSANFEVGLTSIIQCR